MGNLTKSPKVTVPYSIRPKCLPPEEFREIIRRLNTVISEVAGLRVDFTRQVVKAGEKKKQLLLKVSRYLSEVKIAQLLLHISPNARGFDDHDLVASLILHQFNYYEHVCHPESPTTRLHIDSYVREWMDILPANKQIVIERAEGIGLKSQIEFDFSKLKVLNVGILTVLEHEYQSIIRRLDRVYACSGNYAEGSAIRYRANPSDDLKDISTRLRNLTKREIGWTIGLIGSETVVVICVGDVGKDNARSSIYDIQDRLNFGVEHWLDVGVCAGTNKDWPIGTVLISDKKVIDLKRLGTGTFAETDVITPLALPLPTCGTFSLDRSYRRIPQFVENIPVAHPHNIKVLPVKFACVPDVIKGNADREAIRSLLLRSNHLSSDEEFGIEMEAAGTTLYGDSPTMCIIKAVCDYADDSKASWPPGTKNLYQLYAAETAADYMASLVKNWHDIVKPKEVGSTA